MDLFHTLPPIQSAALKLGLPLLGAVILLLISRLRGVSRQDLGFLGFRPSSLLLWLGLYLAYMFGTDYVMHWRGPFDFAPWRSALPAASLMRILAVCFAGPFLEELIFRGALFNLLLKRTPLGAVGTVIVTAVAWAALHYAYSPPEIALIAGGGLILGAARLQSRSLWVPVLMHVCWNLYAIW